ncbi:hypothetical protein FB451DRAFT_1508039 [Mycena latifolia]|nr:hypothetical protein FB451DRAFT_1508039 [Mycena latifolia]
MRHPASSSMRMGEDVLDLVFHHHHRLKHLHLYTRSLKLPPYISSQRNLFPSLSSLHIIGPSELDVVRFLPSLYDAPRLQDLLLLMHRPLSDSLASGLPWSQFTQLDLQIPVDLRQVRDILAQCEMLEDCEFSGIINSDNLGPSQNVYQLNHLHRLKISTEDEPIPETFFAALAFPNLLDLVIETPELSPRTLPDLYDRSKFSLVHFGLFVVDLDAEDVIPFLRQLPALQTLEFYHCCTDDALFRAFTYGPDHPVPSFALPQLKSLTVQEDSEDVNGAPIADMGDSICAHPGGKNLAFPALMEVHLSLHGPRFADEIEARLAAACATGLIKEHRTRM